MQQLSRSDTMAMGFMAFAFFFGAGNLIFPPLAGFMAGESYIPAMLGFLATGVGLPLCSLLIAAKVGGGLPKMAPYLPAGVVAVLVIALYMVIGPAFAIPRTSLVAFEMGGKPLLGMEGSFDQALFTASFFAISFALGLNRSTLLDRVGKILTPLLLLLLLALAATVIINPFAAPNAVADSYAGQAFSKGFLEGYNTMDSLGGIMFGMLFVELLRQRGVTEPKAIFANLSRVSLIAAVGLAVVYGSLFYLGATAGTLADGADNGGTIIINTVQHLFGAPGIAALACMVVLACLTTSVGLLSAIADYFADTYKFMGYRTWLALFAAVSALVANVGLSQLIALSVPVLFLIYPIAIAIMVLAVIKERLPAPRNAYSLVVSVAAFCGLLDAAKVTGIEALQPMVDFASILPLYEQSLAWALPTLAALLVARFAMKPAAELDVTTQESEVA